MPPAISRPAIASHPWAAAPIKTMTAPETALASRRLGPGPMRSASRPMTGAAIAAPTEKIDSRAPRACSPIPRSFLSLIAMVAVKKMGIEHAM